MKDKISQMKNRIEGIKNRLDEAEERISELEDKVRKKLPDTARNGKKTQKEQKVHKGTPGQHER